MGITAQACCPCDHPAACPLLNPGIPWCRDQIALVAGDSLALSGEAFRAAGLPRFRLLSVDGGHSLETTLHDLTLAACLLREGGVMVVDDVVMQVPLQAACMPPAPWRYVCHRVRQSLTPRHSMHALQPHSPPA